MWPHVPRRPDVEVITANPKTAGVARWNFLALWGHRMGKGDAAAEEFVTKARAMPNPLNPRHTTSMDHAAAKEFVAKVHPMQACNAMPYTLHTNRASSMPLLRRLS